MTAMTAAQLADRMPDARQLWSDEPEEMESTRHYQQLALLVGSLEWRWQAHDDFFVGANLTVYYSHHQLRRREFRGPDFFLVRGVSREPRRSWVVWEEDGHYPDLIVELLSHSTEQVDRTAKKSLYQNIFHTPEYVWFSPDSLELAGFRLRGRVYEPIAPDPRGWLWSEVLEAWLGVRDGQLRYFEPDGTLVPTPAEAARQGLDQARREQERAEEERRRADQEHQRAERLARQLRELGLDPDA